MKVLQNYKTTITGIILIILGIIVSLRDAMLGSSIITAGVGFIIAKDGDKQ